MKCKNTGIFRMSKLSIIFKFEDRSARAHCFSLTVEKHIYCF